jgi:tetratricopeptide (TPR) repeat protein
MFRRYLFSVLACAALIFSTTIFVAAQTGQLRGKVSLKQADGAVVPATDVAIEVYRTDVSAKYATKTDKKGEFVFAGVPFVGTYLIVASREGAQPTWIPGVKAGREVDYKIDMVPGDGRRYTPEEIKNIIAQNKGPAASGAAEVKESSEDKAKREELERKNAEILEKNKQAEASNAVIQRTFKAGNDALKLKNYDEAITQFDEGIRADPDHPGAPSLLTNKSSALNSRAVSKFNAAIQSTDDAAKSAGLEAAKKDWKEASEASRKAVEMLKANAVPTEAAAATNAKTNLYFALMIRAEVSRFFVTKVDPSQVDAGVTAYEEYIAAEIDPAKKLQAQHHLAAMLFDANAFDRALSYYQKILETNPDDLDALLRSGQALFNMGAMNNDKAKYQEAADFLARFVEKAPDTNTFKADAKAILETLKSQENVKPVAAPARRRRP